MTSVESDRRNGARQRPGRWPTLAALAIGLAVAGLPTAALPLAAGTPMVEGGRDSAAATALVVEAVLRVTTAERPVGGAIATR
jgi:hypothetical protein